MGRGVVQIEEKVSCEKKVLCRSSVSFLLNYVLNLLSVDPPLRISRSRRDFPAVRGRSTLGACARACSDDYGRVSPPNGTSAVYSQTGLTDPLKWRRMVNGN